jgi:GTP cyclohydrolase IA
MSENNRKKQHTDLECVQIGFANGVAPGFPLTEKEKWSMVDEAEEAYGKFLDALGVDWRNDPNSEDTPRRVAKAYVFDLFAGRYNAMSDITSFQVMDMMVSLLKETSQLLQCVHTTTKQFQV